MKVFPYMLVRECFSDTGLFDMLPYQELNRYIFYIANSTCDFDIKKAHLCSFKINRYTIHTNELVVVEKA